MPRRRAIARFRRNVAATSPELEAPGTPDGTEFVLLRFERPVASDATRLPQH
jgi:hypothetical protein